MPLSQEDIAIRIIGWVALIAFLILLKFDNIGFRHLAYMLVSQFRGFS